MVMIVMTIATETTYLYHAIENTANENTGKPLYIHALRSYSRRNLVSVFSMTWYKMVLQHILVLYYGILIAQVNCIFSGYTGVFKYK